MKKGASTIGCLGLGAGLMYLLDAESGRRRRARLRDQIISGLSHTEHAIGKTARDAGNRLTGSVAEAKMMLMPPEQIGDDVLIARVRARLGRVVSHPHALIVEADSTGRIALRGPILAAEVAAAITATADVRGVKAIDNQLESHADAGDVPGLQGAGRRQGSGRTLMSENWTPTGRMLAGLAGGLLAISAIRRRRLLGTLLGAGGLAMIYRALTNHDVVRLLGVGTGEKSIGFHKTMRINASVERVFSLWRNPENFPQFMSHLQAVDRIDDQRHRWTAKGPAGVPVAWESLITRLEPNRIVAWASVPGSMVATHGVVHFESLIDGGTRIDIRLKYLPPAGALGHAVAALFGADPKAAMDDDLVRLKSLLEDGKTSTPGHRVTLDQVSVSRRTGGMPPAGPSRQAG